MTISPAEPTTMIDSSDLPAHVLPLPSEITLPRTDVPSVEHISAPNLITATITAAASLFSPEQVQFMIIDTSGRDTFSYLEWLPHVAAVHDVHDTASATEARDAVAGLLDSREFDDDYSSRVYVIFNGHDVPRSYPPLAEALNALSRRGAAIGVWSVRSRV